jgi:glycosyltransferase XagB
MGFLNTKLAPARSLETADSLVHQDIADRNIEDSDQDFHNWSTVPEAWLNDAVQRLNPQERQKMLRHKLIPYCWMPTCTIYGAVHEGAVSDGRQTQLNIFGRVQPNMYRKLIRRHLAPQLQRQAVFRLGIEKPEASAQKRLSGGQTFWFIFLAVCAAAAAVVATWQQVLIWLSVAASFFFLMIVALRCLCLMPMPKGQGQVAPLQTDAQLPVYTVLIPMFRETAVVQQLIRAVLLLDYPRHKLDIKIILEESDLAMHKVIHDLKLPWYFDVIIVPSGPIQTKPRALNYAMLFSRGSLATIFDSEDIPQPNQLKLAAAHFAVAPEEVVCLQAALDFYNPGENWLTRQFTAEYAGLFRVILPTLAAYGLPLPLGGTSNHFRVAALQAVGGWDAFNVTEDADLGIRLARHGFQSQILHSTTYEEATKDFGNWLKQRRRWLKGFVQTWLVHNRHPIRLLRDVGLSGFCVVQAMTLGVFIAALLHPVLMAITIWHLMPSQVHAQMATPMAQVFAGLGLAVLLAGYISAIGTNEKGLRKIGVYGWTQILLTVPAYWMLISLAAWLALWDFIVSPFHWHKTEHGRSRFMRAPGRIPANLFLTRHQNDRRAKNDNEDHGQEEQDHGNRQLRR